MDYIVNKIIWGWPLIILLLVASVYYGIRTRFVQLRFLKLMPKLLFEKNEDKEKISSFQSISLVLANHVGTGNIVGVSIAIMYGGPGAIFWMWITAVLCSVLAFVENTLGQMYKIEVNGEYRGGPAYYILKGIGSPLWAHIISFVFFICLGLFMPTIQSATISSTIHTTFTFPKLIIGLFVTLTIGFIIFGNSKRIVHVAEVVVPFMAVFYIIVATVIILVHFTQIDNVFLLIINNALKKDAIYGSILGSAISYGMRRGLFSNEAGVGSSSNISASSNVTHPAKQGLISTFCVFIDTIIICSATAFMILVTNCYNIIDEGKTLYVGVEGLHYGEYVGEAINTVFNNWGTFFVTIALFFFAYTSLFSGFYNAQSNLIFIFKSKKTYKIANFIYKCVFLSIIFLSSIFNTDFAWSLADMGIGIAALVNIIVIVLLSGKVLEVLHDFELKYKKKDQSRYFNKELECWRK
ncbi:alanine:cation symporter family protein [Mycoplasmatota bacterium]|nr:alanine:cation symporter family protein [Mycoplasmatota bacterium]